MVLVCSGSKAVRYQPQRIKIGIKISVFLLLPSTGWGWQVRTSVPMLLFCTCSILPAVGPRPCILLSSEASGANLKLLHLNT